MSEIDQLIKKLRYVYSTEDANHFWDAVNTLEPSLFNEYNTLKALAQQKVLWLPNSNINKEITTKIFECNNIRNSDDLKLLTNITNNHHEKKFYITTLWNDIYLDLNDNYKIQHQLFTKAINNFKDELKYPQIEKLYSWELATKLYIDSRRFSRFNTNLWLFEGELHQLPNWLKKLNCEYPHTYILLTNPNLISRSDHKLILDSNIDDDVLAYKLAKKLKLRLNWESPKGEQEKCYRATHTLETYINNKMYDWILTHITSSHTNLTQDISDFDFN